jgi:mono/diheme cytochrome c family protein
MRNELHSVERSSRWALLALLVACNGGTSGFQSQSVPRGAPADASSPRPDGSAVVPASQVDGGAVAPRAEAGVVAPPGQPEAGVVASHDGAAPVSADAGIVPPAGAVAIPAEPQRTNGDPAKGYTALVNGGYISLGIPWSGFSSSMTQLLPADTLPGRVGKNAEVGFSWNVSTNSDGMEIVSANCLACHATTLPGTDTLYVGLGVRTHAPNVPSGSAVDPALITLGLGSAAELAEFQEYGAHLLVSQAAGTLIAVGSLASHRDPSTLAWLTNASFDAATGLEGWDDVPPWWRLKKVNAVYASGEGRGDQIHHMMNATVFSADSVAEIQAIDTTFVDIAAYLRSIEPPPFPLPVDASKVAVGEQVFRSACATCHGTYGTGGSYPNLLIPVGMVGTDPELAQDGWMNTAATTWFSASFYGMGARFELTQNYIAPPLDGIWATAPFFHNGSVPTLEGVIDSSKRPATWSLSFGVDDFDSTAVGWKGTSSGPTFDTTQAGNSNAGHQFGDALSSSDQVALLEYLKTL